MNKLIIWWTWFYIVLWRRFVRTWDDLQEETATKTMTKKFVQCSVMSLEISNQFGFDIEKKNQTCNAFTCHAQHITSCSCIWLVVHPLVFFFFFFHALAWFSLVGKPLVSMIFLSPSCCHIISKLNILFLIKQMHHWHFHLLQTAWMSDAPHERERNKYLHTHNQKYPTTLIFFVFNDWWFIQISFLLIDERRR